MKKILSISIAAYNVDKFLEKALRSLLVSDDYLNKLEVFIVDDGSTDRTVDIANKYIHMYSDSFFLISKENGGYGSTINAALKKATGKYFKLLDGDDWFKNENLECFIDFLEETDSDIVLSPYETINDVSGDIKFFKANEKIDSKCIDIERAQFDSDGIAMHMLAVKTSVLVENHIQITEHCFYTDQEFNFFSTLSASTVSRFAKPIYQYRLGLSGQSISIEGYLKHYKDLLTLTEKMCPVYEKAINNVGSNKQELLSIYIRAIVGFVYLVYCRNKDKDSLVKFDYHLKKDYPSVYSASNSYKKVKLLRMMNFTPFDFLADVIVKKSQNGLNN